MRFNVIVRGQEGVINITPSHVSEYCCVVTAESGGQTALTTCALGESILTGAKLVNGIHHNQHRKK